MQTLVTGGAGFIGGHLAAAFLRDGHDVVALDSLHPFYDVGLKRRNVERCHDIAADTGVDFRLAEGDIRDQSVVDRLVAGSDYVFHNAAQAGVRASVDEPRRVDDVNAGGTVSVLEAARKTSVERVVCAGSSSVYGRPEYLPYDEAHPTTPVSPYGVSKLASDHYARVYHEIHGVPTVVLRYFTVYGPRMRPDMAISNFVSRCENGEPPVVYGDGSQTRDFTYVDDVIQANRALVDNAVADGQVINVGSGDRISIADLAEVVRDLIDPDLPVVFDDRHDADADHTHADIGRARDLLNYDPAYSIREGVSAFVSWYERNRDWYEPLVYA